MRVYCSTVEKEMPTEFQIALHLCNASSVGLLGSSMCSCTVTDRQTRTWTDTNRHAHSLRHTSGGRESTPDQHSQKAAAVRGGAALQRGDKARQC